MAQKILLTTTITLVCFFCNLCLCYCCPQQQKDALLQFKSLFTGKSSSNSSPVLSSWNSTSDCCQWEGATCSIPVANSKQKVVTYLYLRSLISENPRLHNAVKSDVLAPLLTIRTLSILDISFNQIQGEIPPQFGNLTNLQVLSLKGNNFSGEIPASMSHLQELSDLDMGSNQLSGEIPSWLFSLTKLRQLHLRRNKFTWKNLGTADLSRTSVIYMDLRDNSLTGTFPEWLVRMQLKFILLSNNKLTGSLPPPLFQSQKLRFLDLSGNNFSGRLPESIGEATDLAVLTLTGNSFSGSIPKSFSNLSRLIWLDLSRNEFSGDLTPIFSQNSYLILAKLSENEFSGALPQSLGNSTQLALLDLHDNRITGEILSSLPQISSLLILILSNNSLSRSIPKNMSSFNNLLVLDVSFNNLSGKIPPSLGQMQAMVEKNEALANYDTYLHIFSIFEIMPRDFELPELEVLWKKAPRKLPYGQNFLYTLLDMSSNQFSGEIPGSLGELKNMKLLNISHNKLFGRIPASFGDLESVEGLDLSHNSLAGEIPQTFGKLLQLNVLDLSDNKLTGRIPNGPQMDRLNDPFSYANNNGLCGMQIRISCEPEPTKMKPVQPAENEIESGEEMALFSWRMAGFGVPFGFVSTVTVLYLSGFFYTAPKRRRRCSIINESNLSILKKGCRRNIFGSKP